MAEFAAWLDRYHVSLSSILTTIVLLIVASGVIILLKRLLQRGLARLDPRVRLRYETVLTITRIVSGALWAIVGMLILEIWGVSLGGFWTLLVSAAAVIGVGFL